MNGLKSILGTIQAVEKVSEFRFLANGSCTIVPPPSKKRKTPKML